MTKFNNQELAKYNTVGGWLLLLCLALTIFSPLRTVYNLFTSYEETSPYFGRYPGLENLFYVDAILSSLLMILSIRAGLALWNIKPGAVKIAKNYLLVFLGYAVIASFLPFMAGLPSNVNEAMVPEVIGGAMQSLFFFVVWFWYLSVSKRVKATYRPIAVFEESETIAEEPEDAENKDRTEY